MAVVGSSIELLLVFTTTTDGDGPVSLCCLRILEARRFTVVLVEADDDDAASS